MTDDAGHPEFSSELTAPAPDTKVRRLRRGDTLGDRFVIVQFLAEGGMGEVYEAADLHLQSKHCALKTLRSEIAANPDLRLRFEREVLLAREVTHPNVCPTYDIFNVSGPDGPMMFLTMKLLRGESLLAHLKRVGRFEPAALASIGKQMAEALDAAHRVGVIHRDFKPGNVMLEYSGRQEPQVSITDFGLSRAYESDATLAETGQILGTPGYIAPELIQGRIAAFTVDVYAFGVVLYEMATGQKPAYESGKSKFARPGALVPELPPIWDKIIPGCLEQDPAKRFQSAGEAMALLDAPKSSPRAVARRSRIRPHVLIAAGLAVMLAIFLGWLGLPNLETFLHPLPQKRFVALMPWPLDSNAEHRPLMKSVLDTIGSRLARAESSNKDLLIISQSDVAGSSLRAPVDAVGALGANLVLAASVHEAADGIALDLTVLDAATSKEIRKTELRISSSDLSRLSDRAAVAAAKLLDVQISSGQWKDQDNLAGVPPVAYQFFTRAEELIAQPNDAGIDPAIEQYQKALEADATFALAYAKLSIAYTQKFQRSHDRASLNLAGRNADLAMRYNRNSAKAALSRAMFDMYSGNSQEAIGAMERALKLDPGNPQILLYKAHAYRELDRRSEEESVYREILKDRPNFWPAYYELGFALYRQGNYQKAADAFAEGSAVAPRVARLLTNLGAMDLFLNRKKEAEEAFLHSLDAGPNEVAYLNLGTIAFGEGNYRKALAYYEKARDLKPKNDVTWRNIGDCFAMLGEPARVTESYSRAADLVSESLRVNPVRGSVWMNLAFYEAKLGHRDGAESALKNAEARGATDLQSQLKRAQALALLGRHEEALQLVLESLKKGLSVADVGLALDLKEVRNDPRYQQHVASQQAK